jgi:hypothetical protein
MMVVLLAHLLMHVHQVYIDFNPLKRNEHFVLFLIGLYPDWNDPNRKNGLENAKEAMDLAERWLGIPQLIDPNDMINPKVDEQSMMTYLSQYPNAKLKPGAPIRPKTNAARVRCYGKGLYISFISNDYVFKKRRRRRRRKGPPADAPFFFCSLTMNYH